MYFVLSTFCCGPCEGFVLTFSNSNFTNLRELSGYYRHWFIMFLQNNKADAAAAAYSNLFVKLCLLQPRNDISYPSSMPEWVLAERLDSTSDNKTNLQSCVHGSRCQYASCCKFSFYFIFTVRLSKSIV